MLSARAIVRLASSLALLALPGAARAASPACDAAYDRAQADRAAGRYAAARASLLACARPACGPEPGSNGSIERDCAAWLEEDSRRAPTLVLGAKDERGRDLVAVRVTLDGAPIERPLDGRPIPVDTGPHRLVFEGNGARVAQIVVARYGEPGVPVVVTLARAEEPPRAVHPLRIAGLAGVAVGLVGLAVGAGLGVAAGAANADAGCDASNACDRSDSRRDARALGGGATATLLAGGALVVGGVVLALLAPRGHVQAARSAASTAGATF